MVEENEHQGTNNSNSSSKPLCDFCGGTTAVLYCRADSAALCLPCDRHVHVANTVSSKHDRALLCDSCSSAPSSVLCSSSQGGVAEVLCSNCDYEKHGGGGGTHHHERRPVEAFSGCPDAVELVSVLGVGDGEDLLLKKKEKEKEEAAEENFNFDVWRTPQVVRLDELVVSTAMGSSHGFKAMGVPPLPKNRNLACGKKKDEILQQLRDLIKSEGHLLNDLEEADPITEFQCLFPNNNEQEGDFHNSFEGDAKFTETPSFEVGELQWNENDWHEATDQVTFSYDQLAGSFPAIMTSLPDRSVTNFHSSGSDGNLGPNTVGESVPSLTPKRPLEFVCPDRDSVISRYKEKRKARRYDKLIRYESRKARADSRVRIKGRFAKMNHEPNM